MMHSPTDVVRLVTVGLMRQSRGYLVLVPPGFDRRPDLASRLEAEIQTVARRRGQVVAVSADWVTSDEDLVDLLIRNGAMVTSPQGSDGRV